MSAPLPDVLTLYASTEGVCGKKAAGWFAGLADVVHVPLEGDLPFAVAGGKVYAYPIELKGLAEAIWRARGKK